ncbi:hypothetical protein HYV10_02225, partial [Candidatus Dependentiae bacterium]|nr:hypothetical protein [Candidatus Dependentiae bacterium]
DENAQIVHELCSISRNNFKDWCKNSREQEKLEEVSKLIADFTTTPFIFCKSLKGCSGILAEAKNAVNFQRAVELAEELGLGFQEAEELLVATEAGVQKLPASAIELETAVTSMMENEKQNILKQSSLSVDLKNSFEQVLDKLLTEGVSAADLSFQKEVLSYFNVMFRKPGYCVLDKQIETLFDKVSIVYHGKNKFLYCNPEHVLTPNLKFQLNKFTNLFEGRIYGSHYGRVTEYLEIQNLINVVEQYPLHNGRAIKYKHPFGNFLEIKTEFGSNLSQEQIMNNIIEVVQSENYLYQDRWFNGFKYKTHKIAVTKDGSIIEVFLLEQNADELFIETAYPYFEMFSKVKGLKWKP